MRFLMLLCLLTILVGCISLRSDSGLRRRPSIRERSETIVRAVKNWKKLVGGVLERGVSRVSTPRIRLPRLQTGSRSTSGNAGSPLPAPVTPPPSTTLSPPRFPARPPSPPPQPSPPRPPPPPRLPPSPPPPPPARPPSPPPQPSPPRLPAPFPPPPPARPPSPPPQPSPPRLTAPLQPQSSPLRPPPPPLTSPPQPRQRRAPLLTPSISRATSERPGRSGRNESSGTASRPTAPSPPPQSRPPSPRRSQITAGSRSPRAQDRRGRRARTIPDTFDDPGYGFLCEMLTYMLMLDERGPPVYVEESIATHSRTGEVFLRQLFVRDGGTIGQYTVPLPGDNEEEYGYLRRRRHVIAYAENPFPWSILRFPWREMIRIPSRAHETHSNHENPCPPSQDQLNSDKNAEAEEDACRICYVREKNTVLEPCGHETVCMQCTKEMVSRATAASKPFKCPFCRGLVSKSRQKSSQ